MKEKYKNRLRYHKDINYYSDDHQRQRVKGSKLSYRHVEHLVRLVLILAGIKIPEVHLLVDPGSGHSDIGVDARDRVLTAADAPGDDSGLGVPVFGVPDRTDQGTATVTLGTRTFFSLMY